MAGGHAGRAADHGCAGLAEARAHHGGHGLSGAGGVDGDAGGDWRLALHARCCARSRSIIFFCRRFTPSSWLGAQEWVAMFSFAASSLVAGRVAERARRQTQQAEQRREDVERLYMLSQEMMLHDDAAGLMRELPRLIHRIFALEACGRCMCAIGISSMRLARRVAGEPFEASLRAMTPGTQRGRLLRRTRLPAMPLMLGMRAGGRAGVAAGRRCRARWQRR